MRKLKHLLLILMLVPLMFAQYEIPIENLLTNSGFGVWSQADANAGIAALTYDTGSAGGGNVPDVGDAVTGGASGATGKIMSMTIATGTFVGNNATGVIQLGSTTGCFNDDEALAFDDGETAVVNHPDGAVGADKLVKNGAFVHNIDPPNDWTASNSTLTTEVGGSVGNCMKVLDGGAGSGYGYQQTTTVVGKIYKFSCWAKDIDTGQDGLIEVGTAAGNAAYYSSGTITADAGATYTRTFEATTVTTFISLNCTTVGGTYYFDEVTLYEITDGCTLTDTKAIDGWLKDTSCDVYRQYNDGGTYTKDGSFYALKIVVTTAGDFVTLTPNFTNIKWYQQFASRTVTVGLWAKTSTVSHTRIRIDDGTAYSSSYHTGGGAWEWLELTHTVSAAPTYFFVRLRNEAAPNIDGTTIVYASQPMLAFGSSIGTGNYSPRQHEVILLEKAITSNTLNSLLNQSDLAVADLNVEADSSAMLPKGCKAIKILTYCNDSASIGLDCYLALRADATKGYEYYNAPYGQTNNTSQRTFGWIQCDSSGDIDRYLNASGANTFSLVLFKYLAVQVTD